VVQRLGAVLGGQFRIKAVLALSQGGVAEVQPFLDFLIE
jgi:hypothetical protein